MGNICPNCGGKLILRFPAHEIPDAVQPEEFTRNTLKKNTGRVWLASGAVWAFLAVSSGISLYEFDRSFGKPPMLQQEFVLPLVNDVIFAFLTPFVFFLARRYPLQKNGWLRRSLLYLGGGFLFTAAHVALRCLAYPVWDPRISQFTSAMWNSSSHVPEVKWLLIERLFLYNTVDDVFSTYFAIVLVSHAVWYYQNFRDREIRASQLETQLTKARLKALKSQMQPHFLFNTMHSISALILTDAPAADKMITRLGDFLRITLDNDDLQFTTLNRELEFIRGYLEIEKVRFEERLNLTFNVSADTLSAEVPHLLLQPLVENAVQHGISKRPTRGELAVSSERRKDDLYITIRDNGPGLPDVERTRLASGLGLRGTRERLATIYGENHSFDIHSLAAGGVEVNIRIPFSLDARPTMYPLELEASASD
jgi:two-component system LytT family sensor kinase